MKPYGFKKRVEYLESHRNSEMTKTCKFVEKSICAAIDEGENEVEVVFTDGHHPLVPLEDVVNEVQDLLRASGFQVTKNKNVLREERGESAVFPFSLKVKWGWEITTKKEKVNTPLGKVEVNTIE
jgi:hypothetical protein